MSQVSTTGRRQRASFWAVIVAGTAVVVLGIVMSNRFGADPRLIESPVIGTQVPSLPIPYLNADGSYDLAAADGDISVVNFWASWCLSCRDEHPALNLAAKEYAGAGVRFVGVLYQDQPANGIAFLDELGWGDPYLYVVDGDSRAALEFGVLGLPETFFVDQNGTVVGKVSGPINYALLSRTLDAIILGESVGEVKTGEVQNRG